ncbi:hypothetical protein [Nocardioides sp.]|uniref:hypothetical protein n=1 Tax=Nocardioides sp. TaxID=35761 RepID=UPI0035146171
MWFKIDDKFPRHRKARAARRGHPTKRRDVGPVGLWALAGAESDDGFIATEILEDWDDDAEILAERLVDAGLWFRAERGGEKGYAFHDWTAHNPVDASNAGSFGNHQKWHVNRGVTNPDCPHCEALSCPPIRPDLSPRIGGILSVDDRPESLPDPTRPDPTRPSNPSRSRSETDSTPPPRFEEFWSTYDHRVGKAKATRAYRAALKKPGVTPEVLITAAAAYIAWQTSEGKHPEFTKHPTTWLNGEHWRDEPRVHRPPQTRTQQHLQLAADLAERDQVIPFPQIGDGA